MIENFVYEQILCFRASGIFIFQNIYILNFNLLKYSYIAIHFINL